MTTQSKKLARVQTGAKMNAFSSSDALAVQIDEKANELNMNRSEFIRRCVLVGCKHPSLLEAVK